MAVLAPSAGQRTAAAITPVDDPALHLVGAGVAVVQRDRVGAAHLGAGFACRQHLRSQVVYRNVKAAHGAVARRIGYPHRKARQRRAVGRAPGQQAVGAQRGAHRGLVKAEAHRVAIVVKSAELVAQLAALVHCQAGHWQQHRRRVAVEHGDADRHLGALQLTIAGAVAEAVGAHITGGGCVDRPAIGVQGQAAMGRRLADQHIEHRAIGVTVIGQHVDGDRLAAYDGGHISGSHRRPIWALDHQIHPRQRTVGLAVGHAVEKAVGALEAGIGPVGQAAVGCADQRAVLRRAQHAQRQRVAIGIDVIGQQVEQLRAVTHDGKAVGPGHRRHVVGGVEGHVVNAHFAGQRANAQQVEAPQRRGGGGDGRYIDAHRQRCAGARQLRQRGAVEGDAGAAADAAVGLDVDRGVGSAQADRPQQRQAGVQVEQGHLKRIAHAAAGGAKVPAQQIKAQRIGALGNAQSLLKAGIEAGILAQRCQTTGKRHGAARCPGRTAGKAAIGHTTGQQCMLFGQFGQRGRALEVGRLRQPPLTQVQGARHHAGHTALQVGQAQHMAVLMRQQRQQVHAAGGRPGAGAPQAVAVAAAEFFLPLRCGVDVPAAAGSVVVNVNRRAAIGLDHAVAQGVATQVADHDLHPLQPRQVGAGSQPGRTRLFGQRRYRAAGQGRCQQVGAQRGCRGRCTGCGARDHLDRLEVDAAVIVFDGQRGAAGGAEVARDRQPGIEQLAAVVEGPGDGVGIAQSRVDEAAHQRVKPCTATGRRLRTDVYRGPHVVDQKDHRRITIAARETGHRVLELQLGDVKVGPHSGLVVVVDMVDLVRLVGQQRMGAGAAVAPINDHGVGRVQGHGCRRYKHRDRGAFVKRHHRRQLGLPLGRRQGQHHHAAGGRADATIVVFDLDGHPVQAGLKAQHAGEGINTTIKRATTGHGDGPVVGEGVGRARVDHVGRDGGRLKLVQHLRGGGRYLGFDVVDRHLPGGLGFAQVVIAHGHGQADGVAGGGGGVVVDELALNQVARGAGRQVDDFGDAVAPFDRQLKAVVAAWVVDGQLVARGLALVDGGVHACQSELGLDVVDAQRGGGLAHGHAGVVIGQHDGDQHIVAIGAGRVVVTEVERNLEAAVAHREADATDRSADPGTIGPCRLDGMGIADAHIGEYATQHGMAPFVDLRVGQGECADVGPAIQQHDGFGDFAHAAVVIADDDAKAPVITRRAAGRCIVFKPFRDGEGAGNTGLGQLRDGAQAAAAVAPIDLDDVGVAAKSRVGKAAGYHQGLALGHFGQAQLDLTNFRCHVGDVKQRVGGVGAHHIGGRHINAKGVERGVLQRVVAEHPGERIGGGAGRHGDAHGGISAIVPADHQIHRQRRVGGRKADVELRLLALVNRRLGQRGLKALAEAHIVQEEQVADKPVGAHRIEQVAAIGAVGAVLKAHLQITGLQRQGFDLDLGHLALELWGHDHAVADAVKEAEFQRLRRQGHHLQVGVERGGVEDDLDLRLLMHDGRRKDIEGQQRLVGGHQHPVVGDRIEVNDVVRDLIQQLGGLTAEEGGEQLVHHPLDDFSAAQHQAEIRLWRRQACCRLGLVEQVAEEGLDVFLQRGHAKGVDLLVLDGQGLGQVELGHAQVGGNLREQAVGQIPQLAGGLGFQPVRRGGRRPVVGVPLFVAFAGIGARCRRVFGQAKHITLDLGAQCIDQPVHQLVGDLADQRIAGGTDRSIRDGGAVQLKNKQAGQVYIAPLGDVHGKALTTVE